VEYLYQTNMKISIPFLISTKNYGILIDTESAMIFDGRNGTMSFTLDTVDEISYYIIIGENFDEIVAALRTLTGRATMLPRWAFGYIQSKERYHSSEDLLNTVAQFRASGIPLDCIVQDWLSWAKGLWGEKRADPIRYPDLTKLMNALHGQHVRLMVSVWPNMSVDSTNYREFHKKGLLLPNSSVYNAFDESARAIYWKQCNEDWFSAGIDALWCDNTEPFSDADWNGETKRTEELRYQLIVTDSQKSMDWKRLNTFGLFQAKGIYENWRRQTSAKRVTNLSRSTYLSGQRYGVIAWSGDVSAKWSVLQNQIVEGIKFCMSGAPYWTLDIGGFFTVRDKFENRGCEKAGDDTPLWFWDGDYNDGVADLGYRELYVRWLQYATFLPIFRSHGTDTPREPWNFGHPGELCYDAILTFIRLRYRLLPYIYSIAASVSQHHDTMMRSLMFDFAHDDNVKDACHSYMFGKSLLDCPVTEPMYYGPNNTLLQNTQKTWDVYLPKPGLWYDFWTNQAYDGGQTIPCEAPLHIMPLFVKAGSIMPFSDTLVYTDERNGEVSEILVYDGENGEFNLYNDEGDGYSYEAGNYSLIRLIYQYHEKTLTFGKVDGKYRYQENFTIKLVEDGRVRPAVNFIYKGEEAFVSLA
ncbi:MAG TPA: TIM-barrel domain-containing protein, partial [Negativicutes bacterium]|nr:TIM-barrel domain-containing protein [Negativicutes bacterium]